MTRNYSQVLCSRVSDFGYLRRFHSDQGSSMTCGYGPPSYRAGHFIDAFKANGGEILPIEKTADVKIVDHARKEALPGTCVSPI